MTQKTKPVTRLNGERGEVQSAPPTKRGKRQIQPPDIPFEDHDKRRIVRIGRMLRGNDKSNPQALPLHVVTVAMVDRQNQNEITYHNVDTWYVNGLRVGDYASAETITSIYQITKFVPDELCNRPYRDGKLDEYVLHCLELGQPRPVPDDDSDVPQSHHRKLARRSRPAQKRAPLRPIHTLDPYRPAIKHKTERSRDIDVVICFVNDLTSSSMRLPRNYQATLDYTESISSFLNFVRDIEVDKDSGTTLAELFEQSNFMYWADIEIWVLPQGATKMSRWTAESDCAANDFLDPTLPQNHRNQLYIQVRIREHPDARRKDMEWIAQVRKDVTSKGSPTRTLSRKSAGKRTHKRPAHKKNLNCSGKLISDPSERIAGDCKATALAMKRSPSNDDSNLVGVNNSNSVPEESKAFSKATMSDIVSTEEKLSDISTSGNDSRPASTTDDEKDNTTPEDGDFRSYLVKIWKVRSNTKFDTPDGIE